MYEALMLPYLGTTEIKISCGTITHLNTLTHNYTYNYIQDYTQTMTHLMTNGDQQTQTKNLNSKFYAIRSKRL